MITAQRRSFRIGTILIVWLVSILGQIYAAVPHAAAAQTIVSKVVKNAGGKGYLEVDGKPYLFQSVENWGRQQILGDKSGTGDWRYNTSLFPTPMPVSWLENVFEKTKTAGFNTMQMFLKWNEIEPTAQGSFDWSLIDQYIAWANQYDIRLDLVWTGSIHCGGARFPGYTNGWMTWLPEYVQDHDKYYGNGVVDGDIHVPWLPDGGPHHADASYLFASERNAVSQLFAHLAANDSNHRVIQFQVLNEVNWHPEWSSKKAVILDLLNQMGRVVKESDYVVATRVNLASAYLDSQVNQLPYIDSVGADPYTTSVTTIVNIINETTGSDMPHISENDGGYDNTSTLTVASLVNGGFYNVFQLNDHFPSQGIYNPSISYKNWVLGTIPPLRGSGQSMKNLNLAVNKTASLIARTSKSKMAGFNIDTDKPLAAYDAFRIAGAYEIGYRATDSSVGMAVNEGNAVYVMSDTNGTATFKTRQQPISVSAGYKDGSDQWVSQQTRAYTDNGDGTYSIVYSSHENIRIELPASTLPSADSVGYWKLNEGSGSAAADVSGYDRTATVTNGVWVAGRVDDALSFNGASSYASTSWGKLTGNSARTMALWFKTSSSSNANFLSWGVNVSNQLSQLGIYNGGLGYLGYGNNLTTPASAYADGNWHHLAVAYDGSVMELYVDGALANTAVTTLQTGSSALNIGRSVTASNYFNGALDEVFVYNRALTGTEIGHLAAPEPLGYWRFSEGSGTSTADASGHGLTGTLHHNPAWVTSPNGGALSFNGSSAYVSANWNQLTGNASRTLSLWFKTTGTSNANWLSWGTNNNNRLSQLGVNNGSVGYLGYANDLTTPVAAYADGSWHHLAVTFDGSLMKLYVDGVVKNFIYTLLNTGASSMINIGRSITGAQYYNGALDEVRVFDYPLLDIDVTALYEGGN